MANEDLKELAEKLVRHIQPIYGGVDEVLAVLCQVRDQERERIGESMREQMDRGE